MKDEASNVFRSAADLRARGDAEREAHDVFPDQVPDWTALSENRVLTQALRYLEDSRVKVVGIIGTDPRDIVFLARLVRLYCPDARIFTVGSDLLYLDSLSIADLRGMIIGSTYPLYPANHSWTGSDARSRGQVFPSENAQGVYNAAVVQIARVTGQDRASLPPEEQQGRAKPWEAEGELLIEYSTPVPLNSGVVADPALPPVWISVVGERSLYPVDCRPLDGNVSKTDFRYMYHARPAISSPLRLVINRSVAWAIFLAAASLVLLISYARRLHRALGGAVPSRPALERRAPIDELALALARVLVLAGYFYVASPALGQVISARVELNVASGWWSSGFSAALVLAPIAVILSALLALVAEIRASHSPWRAAEALGTVLVVLVVGYVQVKLATRAWWLLSLDRSAAITGGVSAYVPVAFMMAALGAWLYARRRISSINDTFALAPEYASPSAEGSGNQAATLKRIDTHRGRFDLWFVKPSGFFRFSSGPWLPGRDVLPTLVAAAILGGTLLDTVVFRPISRSDEGWLFDFLFRVSFGLLLTLLAFNLARLHSAWGDFNAALDGFGKIVGGAFERIPRNVSNWLIDAESCAAEYNRLIYRELSAARTLLTGWDRTTELPTTSVVWDTEQALVHLSILEQHLNDAERPGASAKADDLATFRWFARMLSPHWADAAVAPPASSDEPIPDNAKTERVREERLINHLENMLALEAARWVGGALARVWTSIGFLALSTVAMLFAMTSYPFPEQSRVMTMIGFVIAAVVIMVLRVALGSSRNDVISKIDSTAPGRITWDATLLYRMGAYVAPLLGVLTALSFEALDLFRSVLGPILRIFP
jgi:hypothetical protein